MSTPGSSGRTFTRVMEVEVVEVGQVSCQRCRHTRDLRRGSADLTGWPAALIGSRHRSRGEQTCSRETGPYHECQDVPLFPHDFPRLLRVNRPMQRHVARHGGQWMSCESASQPNPALVLE